ncbi:MAG TPA: hypothetical protein VIS96_12875 [Terrimicrobiaceae bacterium]
MKTDHGAKFGKSLHIRKMAAQSISAFSGGLAVGVALLVENEDVHGSISGSMPSGHHDAEELSQLLGAGAEPEPPGCFGLAGHFASLRAQANRKTFP